MPLFCGRFLSCVSLQCGSSDLWWRSALGFLNSVSWLVSFREIQLMDRDSIKTNYLMRQSVIVLQKFCSLDFRIL